MRRDDCLNIVSFVDRQWCCYMSRGHCASCWVTKVDRSLDSRVCMTSILVVICWRRGWMRMTMMIVRMLIGGGARGT